MMCRIFPYLLTLLLGWSCSPNTGDQPQHEEKPVPEDGNGRKHVVCFVYHRFGEDKYPSTNISLTLFEAHLQYLHDQQFEVLTLGEALDYLQDPTRPFREKVAVITVDDGYKSFLTGAIPLLSKFGFESTLFINTESVGGNQYLDWEEIKEAIARGTEIGNHSHSHAHFLDFEEKRIAAFKEDVRLAQRKFRDFIGFSPHLFAYPYGEFDPDMQEAIVELGFRAACAQNSGVLHAGSHYFRIPRFPMGGPFTSMEGFREKAGMLPLVVDREIPHSFLLHDDNPPGLTVYLGEDSLRWQNMQCFVQGGKCQITVDRRARTVEIRAENPLKARRTLYTLTCRDMNGKWRWYSHLWINTQIKE